MPLLIACPSCGCKVQLAESLLGRRTRCIACGHGFLALSDADRPPPAEKDYPLRPPGVAPPRRPRRDSGPAPLCPRCHRPAAWDDYECPHCGHAFDPLDRRPGRDDLAARRDSTPHRGGLIDALGTVCLIAGALGICTFGIGAAVALLTGIPALIMAGKDLEGMRTGLIDPAGHRATAFGRNKAIVGLVLAAFFGLFYVLVFIGNRLL